MAGFEKAAGCTLPAGPGIEVPAVVAVPRLPQQLSVQDLPPAVQHRLGAILSDAYLTGC